MDQKNFQIVIGKYSKKHNGLNERKVNKELVTGNEALEYLNTHKNKPLYIYCPESVNTSGYFLTLVETDAYKKENIKLEA